MELAEHLLLDGLKRKTVHQHLGHRQSPDSLRIQASGLREILHRGIEVLLALGTPVLAVTDLQHHRTVDPQIANLSRPRTSSGRRCPADRTPTRCIHSGPLLHPGEREDDGFLPGHDRTLPWFETLARPKPIMSIGQTIQIP